MTRDTDAGASATKDGQCEAYTGSQCPQVPPSGSTGQHLRNNEVSWVWPDDTNLHYNTSGKIQLRDQTEIVQATVSAAFDLLHASMLFKNALPDPILTANIIEEALSTAALHVPNAEDLHVRLHRDSHFLTKISSMVRFCMLPWNQLKNEFSPAHE